MEEKARKRKPGGGRKPHLDKKRVLIMMDKNLHKAIKEQSDCIRSISIIKEIL